MKRNIDNQGPILYDLFTDISIYCRGRLAQRITVCFIKFLSSDRGFQTCRTPSLFQAQIDFALLLDTKASKHVVISHNLEIGIQNDCC